MQTNELVISKPKDHPIGPKPLKLKEGSTSVKIYGTWSHSKITDSVTGDKVKNFKPEYTLRYYIGGKMLQKRFTDLTKAKLEARLVLTKIRNNETEALKLTGLDRSAYVEAQSMLSSIDDSPSLLLAINDYVAARKELGSNNLSLTDIAKEHNRRNRRIVKLIPIPALVEEFIEFKEKQNLSHEYTRTLRRLRTFGRDFGINANELSFDNLQNYFDFMVDPKGNPIQPRTKKNAWERIITLLRFGLKRKYLSEGLFNELIEIDLPKIINGKPPIWTPDEFKEMLNFARPELVPFLAIAGFAGVRSQEIHNLDWSQIDLDRKHIKIDGEHAKPRARRVVPLNAAAISWLKLYQKTDGKVIHYSYTGKHSQAVSRDVMTNRDLRNDNSEFLWKRNGLRHSYISYQLALTKKVHEIAMDAGNSENIIFKNYRELVTEEEASRWFSIFPKKEQNIIHMLPSAVL